MMHRSTACSNHSNPLSLFSNTQRAQLGSDLLYLFSSNSSSSSSTSSKSSKSSSSSTSTKKSSSKTRELNEKIPKVEDVFITWPESRPPSSSRSTSPTNSIRSETFIQPDYHTPNSPAQKAKNLKLFSSRKQTETDVPQSLSPRSSFDNLSVFSLSSTMVDSLSPTGSDISMGIRISLDFEKEEKAELKVVRRNGPGEKGDRWGGNWV